VPTNDQFVLAVACSKAAGIVNGKPDGNFHGNDGASRAQNSSIEARQDDEAITLQAPGKTLNPLPAAGSNPYTDVGDPPPDGGTPTAPHTDNILRLTTAGIVQGKTSTTFDPSAFTTRFQFVKIEVGKLENLTGTTLDDTCGVTYTDAAETDATFGEFVKKASCAGIIQGKSTAAGGTTMFDGNGTQTRYQDDLEAVRGMAFLLGKGDITPLNGTTSNQGYTVNPALFGVKTVSTTSGTNAQRGAVTCTVQTGDTVSLGLVPFLNVKTVNNQTMFKDANQDLRADAMGAPGGPFIQSINGVAQPANTTFVPNVVAGSDGNITFVLNSTTNNSAAGAVVFKDADNNGQLNLSSTDPNTLFGTPSETFGFGCSGAWLPPDATLGTYNLNMTDPSCPFNPPTTLPGVIIALQVLNQFTSCAFTFHYGGTSDVYQYASNVGGPNITITKADFDKYLSGVSTGNLTAAGALGTTRLGDFLTVNYNPGGASTFTITRDVPAPPTAVTATVGDFDAGGISDDVQVGWTAPANPDLGGFLVFRAPINATTGVIGPYANITPGVGIPATATSFNDLNVAPGKYSYIVLAINKQPVGPFPSGPDASPDSVAAQATVAATVPTSTPISIDTTFNNGAGQAVGGPTPIPGDTNILDKNDIITVTFVNAAAAPFNTAPITVAANASITLHDDDGTVVTLTNGVNSTWAVGGTNNSVVTITVTTTPVASATNGGNATMDTNGPGFQWAIDAATGVTNASGNWNIAASGLPAAPAAGFPLGCFGPTPSTPSRFIFSGGGNSACFGNAFLQAQIPQGAGPGQASANADTNTVKIAAGNSGPQGIDNGETFFVTNAAGTQIATGVFNSATGTSVTPSPALTANQTVYVWFVDSVGTQCSPAYPACGRSMPSRTSTLTAATATPFVATPPGTITGFGSAVSPLRITWTTNVQQTGPAGNYTVYTADNSTLVATGTNAVNGPGANQTSVTLNTPLANATNYTLRVAAGTVQNPVGNVPNGAQTVAFTSSGNPSTATITSLVPNHGPSSGGNLVNINGTGFQPGATVTFNGANVPVNTNNGTTINVTAPAGTAGTQVPVTVTNPGETAAFAPGGGYTYDLGAPGIVSIQRSSGTTFLVTFNQGTVASPMNCPGTTAAQRNAWVFTNQDDALDPDGGQATGSPTAVTSGGVGSPTTCTLTYATVGTNDFGTMAYNKPGTAGDQVTGPGGDLPSSNPNVTDASNPVLTGVVAAAAGTNTVTLTMSEGIRCADLGTNDFTVTVDNAARTVISTANCTAPTDNVFDITFDGAGTLTGAVVKVTAVPANTLRDAAGNNQDPSTQSDTV